MINMNSRSQNGSAHVVIIVVLVLALMGALGWVFWQNFSKDKDRVGSTSQSEKKPSSEKTGVVKSKSLAMNTIFSDGLTLEYPDNWKMKHLEPQGDVPAKVGGTTSDRYIFTSPDDTVDLSVQQTSGGGLGGTCDPEEMPTLASFSYEGSEAWNTRAYADYTYKENQKVFVYQGLSDISKVKTLKAGDSVCNVGYLYIVETDAKVGSSDVVMLWTSLTKHDSNERVSFSSSEDAKKYLEGQNAKDIKSILLSLQ